MTDRLFAFIDAMAWVVLTLRGLAFLGALYLDVTYERSPEGALNAVRGRKPTFPWNRHLWFALTAAAWLYTGRSA